MTTEQSGWRLHWQLELSYGKNKTTNSLPKLINFHFVFLAVPHYWNIGMIWHPVPGHEQTCQKC